MKKQTKEEWFKEQHINAEYGLGDYCVYCNHYEEYAFPRESDFEEFCSKKGNYLKNIELEEGCKDFNMGDIDDWG